MRKAVVVLALAPILAVAWGCKGTPAWRGSIETVDGVQVVRNPKAPMYPQGALVLQEELTIGVAEGAEEYTFVSLRGITVDDQGAIFALDQRKPRVDVFSGDGSHIRSIGRRGQGPGEFQTPFFIALAPGGEILVGGMDRLSFFDRTGVFLRSQQNTVQPFAFIKFLENGDTVGTRMVMEEQNPRFEVVLCGHDIKPKVVLASSPMPEPPPPPGESGRYALFSSVIRWDISGGREIVCADGQEGYRLSVFDAGGRLTRTIHKEYDPVPVIDLDVERQMKQHGFKSRNEVTFPRFLPPIWWVYADEDGRIYVSTWQRNPDTGIALFNIFDAEGRYLCDYLIPGEPLVFKDGKLYAIVEDNDGIQYIKRYRMIWEH
jgi:hypothetical protein